MSNLSAFLCQNAMEKDSEKVTISERFKENGKAVQWVLRPITSKLDEEIRKECTKRIPITGKKGQYTQEVDYNKYLGLLAVECTEFPNLHDKGLQDSYGAMGADSLLKTMLLPGEYAEYLGKIQEINGFDKEMDELVEEAKN